MAISTPFNVKHECHVGLDPNSSTGFKGLPPSWKALLQSSGITREETMANPQQVLDVLQFHIEGPPPKMPSRQTLQRNMHAAVNIVSDVDPSTLFRRHKKLGEGASGVVWSATENKTQKKCAVKITDLSDLVNLKNEIAMQTLSSHPNVVQYMGAYAWQNRLWIVMELLRGGSLHGRQMSEISRNAEGHPVLQVRPREGRPTLHRGKERHAKLPSSYPPTTEHQSGSSPAHLTKPDC